MSRKGFDGKEMNLEEIIYKKIIFFGKFKLPNYPQNNLIYIFKKKLNRNRLILKI